MLCPMPVRLLTQSRLRWPEATEVLASLRDWAAKQGARQGGRHKIGVFGRYDRGDALVLTHQEWDERLACPATAEVSHHSHDA